MKFLFATGRTHLPDQVGGAERSIHTLLELLREHGHDCEAVVGLGSRSRRRFLRRLHLPCFGRRQRSSDWHNGYQTHRTAPWLVPKLTRQRVKIFLPDLVVTQLDHSHEITQIALSRGVQVALMVRNAELAENIWPRPHPRLSVVSNSNFIAAQLRDRLNIESVMIREIIRLEDYQIAQRIPEFVSFINPVPLKGIDRALAVVALLPHRRFLFVETWRLNPRYRGKLQSRLESFPNVTLVPWTPDMKTVYSRTAILIVPSEWEEAFGRVALEAQVSGIPVIGRDIGGLSEILQASGTLLPADASPQAWAEEIERLLTDSSLYAARSAAAHANTQRPEFDPKRQMERVLALVSR